MTPFTTQVSEFRAPPKAAATCSLQRHPGHVAPCARHKQGDIIIATINPLVGDTGVQTHTRTLREGLVADGFPCQVQTPFNRRAWWLPIFGVRRIFGPLNRSWSTRWYRRWHGSALRDAMIRRFDQEPPAAVLAQCPVSADAALEVRRRLDASFPVTMVCHFNYSEAKEYRDKGELSDEASYQEVLNFEQRVLGSVDRVIYVSELVQSESSSRNALAAVRASSIIWNGIASEPGMPPISRQALRLSSDHLVLINVGTLEKRKNQIGLVDAFAQVAKAYPQARLLLVGDGPHRDEVRRRIVDLGLTEKVQILGMRRDVPALLPVADLYVHYSSLENCPVVLIEAARAGLPIAAVASGGVPELLEALGGIAVDPSSPQTAFQSLDPLLANVNLRGKMGQASQQAFHAAFTRQAMVSAYLKAMNLPATATNGEAP